jgi:hypothetical protein
MMRPVPPTPKRRPIRQALLKGLVRMPFFGRIYLKGLLRAIQKTPRAKLPPELQQVQTMLSQVPPAKRLELLQAAVKGQLPKPDQMSREMRRAAARADRRRR